MGGADPGLSSHIPAAGMGKIKTEISAPLPQLKSLQDCHLAASACWGRREGLNLIICFFLVQPWVITVEPGGPSAVCGDVIPALRRKWAGLNKL